MDNRNWFSVIYTTIRLNILNITSIWKFVRVGELSDDDYFEKLLSIRQKLNILKERSSKHFVHTINNRSRQKHFRFLE